MRIIQLHPNDGRKVAALDTDNSTVYKQVKGGTNMLRKPPAWTYDEAILNYINEKQLIGYGLIIYYFFLVNQFQFLVLHN